MDIKKILRTYTFWLAFFSGLFLLFQFVFKSFGIEITHEGYMAVIDGILGVFVVAGILVVPPTMQNENNDKEQKDEENADDSNKNKNSKE